MTRIVKGILIDPFTCTVTEVEHDASTIEGIYEQISHESMPVNCFTCAYSGALAPGDAVFIDDEGLLKDPDRFFMMPGNPQPLAGKGLLLGSDNQGRTTDAKTELRLMISTIQFFQVTHRIQDEAMLERVSEPWSKPETVS